MKVFIKDLTFDVIIGILDYERTIPQKVIVDISFKYKFKKKKFIDYSKVVKKVENTMKKNKYKLIEDALIDLNQILLKKYRMKELYIKIIKPDIINNCTVGVQN